MRPYEPLLLPDMKAGGSSSANEFDSGVMGNSSELPERGGSGGRVGNESGVKQGGRSSRGKEVEVGEVPGVLRRT